MILLFLWEPNSRELGLKPSALRLLNMPPDEQDAVADWLLGHQPVPGVTIGRSPRGEHPPGAYISYAPGDVVEPYAIGDVERTAGLFNLLYPKVLEEDMGAAYTREMRLLPLLLDNERQGLRVDLDRLERESKAYSATLARIDQWVWKTLGVEFDISAKQQLAQALLSAGYTTEDRLGKTATGKVATNKKALERGISDPALLAMLRYRGFLATSLQTFIRPWLTNAGAAGGLLHTTWNQVAGNNTAGDRSGTRTGRPSSRDPNFLNVPKAPPEPFKGSAPPIRLPKLPDVRAYVLPREKGHVLLDRDVSQQEPRFLAHFAGGAMKEQYDADPWIDFHDAAKARLDAATGNDYPRKVVKAMNLGLIYGMGTRLLADMNGLSYDETAELKRGLMTLYPGLKALNDQLKAYAKAGKPFRTWGGRRYYCEDPAYSKDPPGEFGSRACITFEYKMGNTLIQGSAADFTKEAMLRYADAAPAGHLLLLQVYDQLLASVPEGDLHTGMAVLRESMESIEVSVPMLSEGDISTENWGAVKPYDRKGQRV